MHVHMTCVLCVYVCVCEFVSTVNRGHTPKLHHQTEDNIANEDSPRFVDKCKRLQIAYGCKLPTLAYRGMLKKKREKIMCTGFGSRFSTEKSYTSCVSAVLHTKCPTLQVVRRTRTSSFSE